MKKVLCFSLVLCMVLCLVPALAEGSAEKVVLKVYRSSPEIYPGWEYGDDPVSAKIEELAGVDIQYTYATTSDNQELYTMLASGEIEDYDIINAAFIPQLIEEEYVVALNDVADEYGYEDFYTYLPKGLIEAHGINGKLYYHPAHYADAELLTSVPAGLKAPANFTVNYNSVVGKVGIEEGSLKTLEDVKQAAIKCKEAGIEYPLFLSLTGITQPDHGLSWSQTLNTSMGGPGFVYPQADGTVVFNYKAEEYKAGLKWLNECYRLGLVKADNFTLTASINDETVKAITMSDNAGFIIGHSWTLEQHAADYSYFRRWKLIPTGDGVAQEDIRAMCWNGSNIGSASLWITEASQNKLAALKWITTYFKPEVQIMCLYGIEGLHYTISYDNYSEVGEMVKSDEMLNDQANMTATDFQKKYGYFNNCISDYRGRFGQVAWDRPSMVITDENGNEKCIGDYDCNLGAEYATAFKTGNLTLNITDTDDLALLNTLRQEWAKNLPDIVLANSDDAFEAAYAKLISQMEKAGVADMEKIMTERYWGYADQLKEEMNAKWDEIARANMAK